jgi:hypothetical protein
MPKAAYHCSLNALYLCGPILLTDGDEEATRFHQTICPLGHYCDKGIVIECPPGRYGGTLGLYDSGCSGPCDAGYYCPSASINKTQVMVIGCCVVCVCVCMFSCLRA